jgi:hypothetical protein
VRGAYRYDDSHLRALRSWLVAASERPRIAVQFAYKTDAGDQRRTVWPIGVVVRDLARVYLVGIPARADAPRRVRTYALERILFPTRTAGIERLTVEDSGAPPKGINRTVVEDGCDLPFSVFPADGADAVHVNVRFTAAQAPYIRGRIWHRNQRERELEGGGVELEFGPADRGEAMAWVRQWGESVTVIEDDGLRRKSHA